MNQIIKIIIFLGIPIVVFIIFMILVKIESDKLAKEGWKKNKPNAYKDERR